MRIGSGEPSFVMGMHSYAPSDDLLLPTRLGSQNPLSGNHRSYSSNPCRMMVVCSTSRSSAVMITSLQRDAMIVRLTRDKPLAFQRVRLPWVDAHHLDYLGGPQLDLPVEFRNKYLVRFHGDPRRVTQDTRLSQPVVPRENLKRDCSELPLPAL